MRADFFSSISDSQRRHTFRKQLDITFDVSVDKPVSYLLLCLEFGSGISVFVLRVVFRWPSSALQWCVLGKPGRFSVN
jgi:hypothetical protein